MIQQSHDLFLNSIVDSLHRFNPWENEKIQKNDTKREPETIKINTEKKLEFALLGVMVQPQTSWAVLIRKSSPNDQIMVHEGEQIDGAWLKKVDRNAIHLDHQGQRVTIEMQPETQRQKQLIDSNDAKVSPSSNNAKVFSPSNAPRSIKRTDFEAMLAKGMGLLAGVKITPSYVNQLLSGYEVVFINENSELKKTGLISHDIISAINDVSVTDTARLQQGLDQIKDQSSLRIDLVRQYQSMTLTLNVEP
ncbi:MAG: hypothetical protein HQL84_15955 [Magnetococcales bacterium]|nr:hypothetical protein [Magnetococcales bacterium]MBF0151516.1 hypothetical protein [Magnetococcales bacterium]MBF0631733.1 hypothetical protein [Magnetococcales bacterium]